MGFPGGIRAESGLRFLPNDKGNLAVAAAVAFRQATGQSWTDLRISIEKRIPVCAGTAGGSSDAAAVLRGSISSPTRAFPSRTWPGLARRWAPTSRIACWVAPPWPRDGGNVNPLPTLPACLFVLCKPRFSISTPALFREWDKKGAIFARIPREPWPPWHKGDLLGIARRTFNVFEGVLPPHQHREIEAIKNTMIQAGALGAAMSGSGPTVFGIFSQASQAQEAWAQLREDYDEVFLAEPLVQNSIP
ncbi:MAG: 4-(cytidine 5'-diphospho)-2-C-methyl-D-erythritol kinase [Evtepia gabavorous]